MLAASNSSLELVRALLQKGANVNARSLVSNKHSCQFLVCNLCFQDGTTALMLACRKPSVEIVEYLIAKGADPYATSNGGFTALIYASTCHQLKAVEQFLVRYKFTDNVNDQNGVSLILCLFLSSKD